MWEAYYRNKKTIEKSATVPRHQPTSNSREGPCHMMYRIIKSNGCISSAKKKKSGNSHKDSWVLLQDQSLHHAQSFKKSLQNIDQSTDHNCLSEVHLSNVAGKPLIHR